MMGEGVNARWLAMVETLLRCGEKVEPRGKTTRELLGFQSVVPMAEPLLTVSGRNLGYRFAPAEAAWILSGDNRLSTIAPFARHLAKFSDDGHAFAGAYGPKFVEQASYVARCLAEDRESRQSVMTFWRERPGPSKDVPCTVALQFLIRAERLECVATMRSSDAWLGWPYDVFSFSMMAAYVSLLLYRAHGKGTARTIVPPEGAAVSSCPYPLGNLFLTAGSQHLYAIDFELAEAAVAELREAGSRVAPAFAYRPLDLSDFSGPDDLTGHLWRVARRELPPVVGRKGFGWLDELYSLGAKT